MPKYIFLAIAAVGVLAIITLMTTGVIAWNTPVSQSDTGFAEVEGAPTPPAPAGAQQDANACDLELWNDLVGTGITHPDVPVESEFVRFIHPDTTVGNEFVPERLNIAVDSDGVITGVRCG